jgi:hypothetical protein
MAQFLPVPANDKIVSVDGFVQSRKTPIWQMSEKFCVTKKLSRWRAKIVTSLLPTPALLAYGPTLKLSRCEEFVTIIEICQGSQSRLKGRICHASVILLTACGWLRFVLD